MTSINDMELLDEVVWKTAKTIKDSFGELFGGKPLPGTGRAGSDDWSAWVPSGSSVDLTDVARAAIRAALQAMVDNGMAKRATGYLAKPESRYGEQWNAYFDIDQPNEPEFSALIIRLDNADERNAIERG